MKTAALMPGVRLQEHQERLKIRARGVPGIVANHGLGSGKSLSALAIAEDRGGKVTVVAPASLQDNFKKELHKFVTPDRHADYSFVSYAGLRRHADTLAEGKPRTLILDEVHRVRNPGKTRDAAMKVRAASEFAVGLTGSLASNDLTDVPRLVGVVAGRPVMSAAALKRNHIQKVDPGILGRLRGQQSRLEISNKKGIRDALGPYVDRFTGSASYRKNVPEVREEMHKVPMSVGQEQMYNVLLKENPTLAKKIRKNLPPSRTDLKRMGAFMTGLRLVSNNPAAFDTTLTGADSPKAKRVAKNILQDLTDNPAHRAVVYSGFIESGVAPVEAVLNQHGVSSRRFTGKEKKKDRQQTIKDFNAGKVPVLFLSPAGGEGLDLKGVRSVDLMEDHWNPERSAQAIGRSARYKSHAHLKVEDRNVTVRRYHAVPQGGRLRRALRLTKETGGSDQWIHARQAEKARLNRDLLSSFGGAQ